MKPKGVLFDYGGTLIEEVHFDSRAGSAWLLANAAYRPPHVSFNDVLARGNRVAAELASLRAQAHLETAWPTVTRLIHDFFGIRFDLSMTELELGFWKASMQSKPMPGARAALAELHRANVPMGVVSNSTFSEHVLRFELAEHGLADHLAFVLVSSDYSVRKPNVLLFETAAARLGLKPEDIWFLGDSLDTDISGARAAGMTSVWFNPRGLEEPSPTADLIVTGWDDFVRHFSTARNP